MRLTLGITEGQLENLKECNCGSKQKCVYYCNNETCPRFNCQKLYCESCEENHDHGRDLITKSCDKQSKEHSALASQMQDAQNSLNPKQERFYALVVILSNFARTNSIQVKKDILADFEKMRTIESQALNMFKTQQALVVKYDIIELLKLVPYREQLKNELLSLQYLEALNEEMIYQNYEEVFKHQTSIPLSTLTNPEDKDFIYFSKIRALQHQRSQDLVEFKAALVEESKKTNDVNSKLKQWELTSILGTPSLQLKVTTLTQTVIEVTKSKQLLEQKVEALSILVQNLSESNLRVQEQVRNQGATLSSVQNQVLSVQNEQIEFKQDQQEIKQAQDDIKKAVNVIQILQNLPIQGGASSLNSSMSYQSTNSDNR
ncbi:hypothetical protein FGO68_gene7969 [Halteria grandinella]|uniref:Uncharacterized protein n=1 Tax=Halteria grandinella TaxID=5974 RepID=A0A8J8NPU2_HALGN|nr:hypothetical protein FGO68_gene7969 [Halteria grandinella]